MNILEVFRDTTSRFFFWIPEMAMILRNIILGYREYREPETKTKSEDVRLKPVIFRAECGRNIRLGIQRQIAYRSHDFCHGYVFIPDPFEGNNFFVVVQILEVDEGCLGSLAIGVTYKNPANTRPDSFPLSHQELNDSDSYLVHSNVARFSKQGDVLIFYLNEKNEMGVMIDGKPKTLFLVPPKAPYWLFFDLYGSTRKIRAYLAEESEINTLDSGAQELESSHVANDGGEPVLKLNYKCKGRTSWYEPVYAESLPTEDPSTGYCIECFENLCNDCMLYPCGHFVLCYGCASKLTPGKGRCPKCLSTVENATRVYRQ